ncbi:MULTISPECIES: TetR/AcrR family transcriptional regulator [unclassified Streptomyces]|jgi:AcrR family transcriptional regulator|uniref:TetR/AcrR family transcriptional regulator n=1 Tax=unclassified Streptomyces TaxID=2593676 RepID=UPI002E81A9B2|nr:TetR/AcrR family transcriptional regulator [Streptomyces sp. NBC_00589]WTI36071.1 TetR/AcrR family transcriptional regulator [Streptomyces sp. NBC_00775]WUB30255.1 TetR/AcrR family transcriptional regulator [Streptomyces sp. NBC_00589]
MGHREDLLEGAKRCLLEKGFVRTTARDIVKESKTNLASIGYHYGSKDALLAEAYVDLISNVGDTFDGFGGGAAAGEPGSLERFQEVWQNVTKSFVEARPIWMLTFEVITNADRLPTVREHLVKASDEGRRGIIPLLMGGSEADVDDETLRSLGGFYQTLLNGLCVQWLFDAESATNADQLTEGLRRVIDAAAKPGG